MQKKKPKPSYKNLFDKQNMFLSDKNTLTSPTDKPVLK